MRDVTQALLELLSIGEAGALATVVCVTGSVPQVAGARLLLRADGSAVGTVGGGALERRVLELLESSLCAEKTPSAQIHSFDLARDLGMCCGGSMSVFIEPIPARERLWVLGAGHVAKPTAARALEIGFDVVVVDERDEWNTEQRFPGCRRELSDPPTCLAREPLGARDWLLIATHDHRLDEETLRQALAGQARYIGLMGSRRKVYRLIQRIAARGGGIDLRRVYAPVGLELGAVTPEEIALSIVAELVALRRQVQRAGHLRAVSDPKLMQLIAEVAPRPLEATEAGGARGVGLG